MVIVNSSNEKLAKDGDCWLCGVEMGRRMPGLHRYICHRLFSVGRLLNLFHNSHLTLTCHVQVISAFFTSSIMFVTKDDRNSSLLRASQTFWRMVTEQEWNQFKENYISKVFKEGSTIVSVSGNWYDPETWKLITEPTFQVIYFYKRSNNISHQIDSLRYWYKTMFQQQSVLRVDRKVVASF